jgi:plasmid segregation protein ParM
MQNCNTLPLVGLDIGYGNLKAVGLRPGQSDYELVQLPVGAAPLARAPRTFSGEPDLGGGERVIIDGTPWVGGTDPQVLQSFSRQVDRSYVASSEYLALFYAALGRLRYDHIGILVTGLPCDQYEGPDSAATKKRLSERLRGEHRIDETRTVTVDHVYLLAQPVGTYASVHHDRPASDGRATLVIDVGFYSVDWVVMVNMTVRSGTAKTSTLATSRILEAAAKSINEVHGLPVSVNRLEAAFRSDAPILRAGRHEIPFRRFIDQAAGEASKQVMTEILSSVRDYGDVMDSVILTGGGAHLFDVATRSTFRNSEVILSPNPVMANAEGYLWMARARAARAKQAA